jgi:adenylate kinase
MATYIVLMGMQGAGKGTQAEYLATQLGLPHITSGGMFRAIMASGSPLGRQIASYYDGGNLVPDNLTIEMIRDRLMAADAGNGVILDGFPRTVPQAESLGALLESMHQKLTIVPYFVITEEEALRRLSGRRVCTVNDNHVYHVIDNPPKREGFCDIDGASLKIRSDDEPNQIKQRIASYKVETTPVLDYYRIKGLLREINAEQPIEKVSADLLSAVEAARKA